MIKLCPNKIERKPPHLGFSSVIQIKPVCKSSPYQAVWKGIKMEDICLSISDFDWCIFKSYESFYRKKQTLQHFTLTGKDKQLWGAYLLRMLMRLIFTVIPAEKICSITCGHIWAWWDITDCFDICREWTSLNYCRWFFCYNVIPS